MKIILNTLMGFNSRQVEIPFKRFNFSGGEVQIVLDERINSVCWGDRIDIYAELRSSDDITALELIKDAIERSTRAKIETRLIMLYVPYARQDRACEAGEAFALKVFARRINAMNFSEVIVADPHSDVTPAVIDNLTVIPQEDIVKLMLQTYIVHKDMAIVSPDGGALKKIFKVAKALGGVDVFCAEKIRDTSNGAILRTEIPVDDFKGRNLLIVDDICDGGMTFIKLAELLKERGAGQVDLYVTHGIFSKGVNALKGVIDQAHSLNVWESNVEANQDILVLNQNIAQRKILEDLVD